jgi:hypothetical protein
MKLNYENLLAVWAEERKKKKHSQLHHLSGHSFECVADTKMR